MTEQDRLAAFEARKVEREVPERIRKFVEQLGISDKLEEVFGPGTTIHDLSTAAHTLDTCGCKREFMWSRADTKDNHTEVPVSTPLICERHAHLWDQMHEHHHVLVTESRHRQHVRTEVLGSLPPHLKSVRNEGTEDEAHEFAVEPELSYDGDGELNVRLRGVSEDEKATVDARVRGHLDRKFPSRRCKVV